ncbi:SET domain-containing protein [Cadophora sp. DSE1049]|nr:SET domain-containing protein [Cadophora sp. DSE1049]
MSALDKSDKQQPMPANRSLDVNNTHKISTRYGTGLAASTSLKPGSLIIKLHKPNLQLIEKDSLQNVCSFCISERPSLKRCSGCKIPYYCSAKCQNAHWKDIHSRECKVLKKLPDVPPTAVRGLIVMLLRKEEEMQGEEESDWKGLESHIGELKSDTKRWEEIMLQARAGVEFTKAGAERMEEAMRWLCVLSTNAFRITLPDNTPVGLCLSPTLARANHSCTPNAFIVFDSRNVSLRALRPIKKDEEIFISYIDPTEDLAQRQSTLKQRYFFTCKCTRCDGNENAYEHFLRCQKEDAYDNDAGGRIDGLYPHQEVVKTAEHCQAILKQNPTLASTSRTTSSKTMTLLKKGHAIQQNRISDLLAAVKPLSSLNANKLFALPPYPQILHEIYLANIDAQTFTPSLITLLFLFIHCDVFMYPQPHHPVRVIRLYTIAKLLKHIASLTPTELLQDTSSMQTAETSSPSSDLRVKEEIAKAFQAMDLINAFHVMVIIVLTEAQKSHGEKSGFVKELEAEIKDVEEVQRLRGQSGEILRGWMGDGMDVQGRKEAEKVGGELRGLAGLMGGILG